MLNIAVNGVRDDVECEIGVSVEDANLLLDIRPSERRRRTRVSIPLADLDAALRFLRDGSPSAVPYVDAGDPPETPEGMLDSDARQILGVTEIDDDFGPPATKPA